ncbi:MAG: Rieske 2Fe-2S domain-containing protein [Proteobacteria bacterium]|nr:Rieske 2Fe-2S domain-containing protein [Pseudomonadota bacterium]
MEYIRVAATGELPTNTRTIVLINGKEVLLANLDGSYYAIANKCTHAGGSLAGGVLKGGIITCPNHGARFNVMTGEAVGQIKVGFREIKTENVECYTVKVEGIDIMVGIPEV